MVRLADEQRAVLVQVFPAVANLGLGAMMFGQFLRQQSFSIRLALAGIAFWLALVSLTVVLAGETMTGVLVLFWGIALIAAIITLLDWLARRRDHRSENRSS